MDYGSYFTSGTFWFIVTLSLIIAYLLARKFSVGSSHVDLSRLDSLGWFLLYLIIATMSMSIFYFIFF